MTKEIRRSLEETLRRYRAFLAYVRANALLHDADKVTEAFLEWSANGGGKATTAYPEHDVTQDLRSWFLGGLPRLFPLQADLNVPFPVLKVAVEPHQMRNELLIAAMLERKGDADFREMLRDPGSKKGKKVAKALEKAAKGERFFLRGDYRSLFAENELQELQKTIEKWVHRWCFETRPGTGLFDFSVWHHTPTLEQKTSQECPTALQLFSAGTAGCDGLDTGYETETLGRNQMQHHEPERTQGKIFIATPFGLERPVESSAAERACAEEGRLKSAIEGVTAAIKSSGGDPFEGLKTLEGVVRHGFEKSVIRTGRPINDVTLADHSISAASLAAAHAARVVLETANSPPNDRPLYALPKRKREDDPETGWPTTCFAIFSCGVNADSLDEMALELKDITAIREEVKGLLDLFVKTFTRDLPVGGFTYQDQYGAHLVVPVLGDPGRRWIKGDAECRVSLFEDAEIPWIADPPGITNGAFVDWLFLQAKQTIERPHILFGQELLVGLRYAVVQDNLNRLAEAIRWSRTMAGLGAGEPIQTEAERVDFFHPSAGGTDLSSGNRDLCVVCGLRFQAPPAGGEDRAARRKCTLCRKRVEKQATDPEETGDIEALAEEGRLALVSVSFNLDEWLSKEFNQGIFCYPKGKTSPFAKKEKDQRLNSFGRLRRIWRSTEDFLLEIRKAVRDLCRSSGEDNEGKTLMRTILVAPQDLQVIVPAVKVRRIVDDIVARFYEQFGRVPGRIPFHISVVVFAYRVPIYLVLEASRRFKRMVLRPEPVPVELCRHDDETEAFIWARALDGRRFDSFAPIRFLQKQPEDCKMGGNDQFHANIRRDDAESTWVFAGDWPSEPQRARMVLNRICIAEIGSGLVLNELETGSEHLPASRCHDMPLEHWGQMKAIMEHLARMTQQKRHSLRSILSRREKLWDPEDPVVREIQGAACEMLWREPGRIGPGPNGWEQLEPHRQELLVDSCLNGMVHLGAVFEKRLQPSDNEE